MPFKSSTVSAESFWHSGLLLLVGLWTTSGLRGQLRPIKIHHCSLKLVPLRIQRYVALLPHSNISSQGMTWCFGTSPCKQRSYLGNAKAAKSSFEARLCQPITGLDCRAFQRARMTCSVACGATESRTQRAKLSLSWTSTPCLSDFFGMWPRLHSRPHHDQLLPIVQLLLHAVSWRKFFFVKFRSV